MSVKSNVLDLLSALVSQVQALPEDSSVADLQSKLDAANAALSDDAQKLADDVSKEAALQAKIDAAKAALA